MAPPSDWITFRAAYWSTFRAAPPEVMREIVTDSQSPNGASPTGITVTDKGKGRSQPDCPMRPMCPMNFYPDQSGERNENEMKSMGLIGRSGFLLNRLEVKDERLDPGPDHFGGRSTFHAQECVTPHRHVLAAMSSDWVPAIDRPKHDI
jgi:hypothetical protein